MADASKREEIEANQGSATDHQDTAKQDEAGQKTEGEGRMEVQTRPDADRETASSQKGSYKKGEAVIAILALLISLGSLRMSYLSYTASQRSADAAEKSAAAAQRSADVVEQSALGYLSLLDIHFDTFRPDEPIALIITWKNDGNSPVTMNESVAKVGVVPYLPPANLCEGKASAPMSPIIVQPHNTRAQLISTGAKDVPSDQVQATIDGNAYFVVCGTVAYQTAGKNFSFPLCSYVKGSGSPFMECGTGRKE